MDLQYIKYICENGLEKGKNGRKISLVRKGEDGKKGMKKKTWECI